MREAISSIRSKFSTPASYASTCMLNLPSMKSISRSNPTESMMPRVRRGVSSRRFDAFSPGKNSVRMYCRISSLIWFAILLAPLSLGLSIHRRLDRQRLLVRPSRRRKPHATRKVTQGIGPPPVGGLELVWAQHKSRGLSALRNLVIQVLENHLMAPRAEVGIIAADPEFD